MKLKYCVYCNEDSESTSAIFCEKCGKPLKKRKNILDTEKYKEKRLKQMAIDLGWKGVGTKENPIIIDSAKGFTEDQIVCIWRSNLYIIFMNCIFKTYKFRIDFCRNIKIDNCSFWELLVYGSEEIEITNSNIENLFMSYSYLNNIKDCTINDGSNIFSRGNIFENNRISEEFQQEILEGTEGTENFLEKTSKFMILYILIYFPSLFSIYLYAFFFIDAANFGERMLVFGALGGALTILAVFIVYFGIVFTFKQKKALKYPPNVMK